MKLITEENINKKALELSKKSNTTGMYEAGIYAGFKNGVYFAETELEKLAIDFKLFCDKNKTIDTNLCNHLTKILFDKFIEEREKTI